MGINRICASIINKDTTETTISAVAPLVELFEMRIDLVGNNWPDITRQLPKPWIACNRLLREGGMWHGSEAVRKEELLRALHLGADVIDIELSTPDLEKLVPIIKKKAKCLISSHNFIDTPTFEELKTIIEMELAEGADICKVVTFAKKPEDNLTILRLIPEFPKARVVAFAMGDLGLSSRILCPLVGGDFTYAAMEKRLEAAPGQIAATELNKMYQMVQQ
ncbi:MAG: type I 3-dehydroquinate dehydratase [Dehalococcoidales bacterium]|nr:type I 3-dehydroquinate dehydratase [Dehalococcoidales bacterium]